MTVLQDAARRAARPLRDLSARGIGLAAIFYDPPDAIRAFTDARGIEFAVLSDAGSEVIRRYGILNREIARDAQAGDVSMYGIPYPGTFVLDGDGRVVERFFEQRYQERFTASSMALRLGEPFDGGGAGTEIDTRLIAARTHARRRRDRAREPLCARRRRHAQAGHARLRARRPSVTGSSGCASTPLTTCARTPLEYPPSEQYHYDPLDETVPVYQQSFRLVQEVTVPMSEETAALSSVADGKLVIEGTLEYQACDDEVCYIPAEAPLRWELAWRPLVRD